MRFVKTVNNNFADNLPTFPIAKSLWSYLKLLLICLLELGFGFDQSLPRGKPVGKSPYYRSFDRSANWRVKDSIACHLVSESAHLLQFHELVLPSTVKHELSHVTLLCSSRRHLGRVISVLFRCQNRIWVSAKYLWKSGGQLRKVTSGSSVASSYAQVRILNWCQSLFDGLFRGEIVVHTDHGDSKWTPFLESWTGNVLVKCLHVQFEGLHGVVYRGEHGEHRSNYNRSHKILPDMCSFSHDCRVYFAKSEATLSALVQRFNKPAEATQLSLCYHCRGKTYHACDNTFKPKQKT